MKEKKIRVSMHSRLNNYETMLFLWASDPMEALEKLKPLIGKGGGVPAGRGIGAHVPGKAN